MNSSEAKDSRIKAFIPDDIFVWLSADIISEAKGVYTVEITDPDFDTTAAVTVSSKGGATTPTITNPRYREVTSKQLTSLGLTALPLDNVDTPDVGVDDLTILNYLHEASILENLRRRFTNFLPYTYTGEICVAINPYKWITGLYMTDLMDEHTDKLR
jgi:myosin-5